MIKELVLHLGDTKTGSTSIQKALVHRVCAAPGKSILYPSSNNHVGLAKTLTQKRRFEERMPRFFRVYEAFQDSDADYGIVSAEHFQFVNPAVLAEAIDAYWPALKDRLRLVAYVRPHAEKFLSTYAERAKLGSAPESQEAFFDSKAASGVFEYAKRFGAWRATFGDRFELRPFVRARMYKGDVIHDFFKYLLGSEEFTVGQVISANTSLTAGQLALLRETHAILNSRIEDKKGPRFREARGAIGRILAEHIRANALGQDTGKLRLPAALADRMQDRYAADAAALDAAFFDGTPMSDALEAIHKNTIETPQSLDAADYFSADVIETARIFSGVLGDMLLSKPEEVKKAVSRARTAADIPA